MTTERLDAPSAETPPAPVPMILGRFTLDRPVPPRDLSTHIAWWRGAVAARFRDNPLFHGHVSDTAAGAPALRHRYPLVQYRWGDGGPILCALGEATTTALSHPWNGSTVQLGDASRTLVAVRWETGLAQVALADRLIRYRFGAPWLALNQENHARWKGLDDAGRRVLLDNAVRNHLLGAFKDLGWWLPKSWRVLAAFELDDVLDAPLKDQQLLGFTGDFVCNLELPNDLAIGKSTSRGHGWFRRVE